MIVEWFVEMALGLVIGLLGFLPEVTLDLPDVSGALATVLTLNGVLPISESLQVGTLLLSVSGAMFAYRVVKILVAHIPGVGGGG